MPKGIVAIIPARGGSSRILRKNAKFFNGRPILGWPLEACGYVEAVSQIVVSTDDKELARIAREFGATEIIDRPQDLATATAGTAPVIKHAIDTLGVDEDCFVMLIYPTATLTPAIISEAIELSTFNPDKFVITVGRHRSPHERSVERMEGGLMRLGAIDHLLTRTQDLPQRYFDAGKLYIARTTVWKAQVTMMEKPFVPFLLPDWASVDIDEPEDWEIAEALHRIFVLEAQ